MSGPSAAWLSLTVQMPVTGTGAETQHAAGVVIVFEHARYGGASRSLTGSDLDLCDDPLNLGQPPVTPCFTAPSWNDVISSIRVSPGYRAILYLHNQADTGRFSFGDDPSFVARDDMEDFVGQYFSDGVLLEDNVSRIVVEKCATYALWILAQLVVCRPLSAP
jgi:hypothetical protein